MLTIAGLLLHGKCEPGGGEALQNFRKQKAGQKPGFTISMLNT